MKDGLVRIGVGVPRVSVADPRSNADEIIRLINSAAEDGAAVLCLPEMCLTGYTCGDLFLQPLLINSAESELERILKNTAHTSVLAFVGLPVFNRGKLYNCAAAICRGELLGLVPKTALPNYSEFYEARHFSPAPEAVETVEFCGKKVSFGSKLLFSCREVPELVAAAEICEDLWIPDPPSASHAAAGATVIVNLSASDETVGKDDYRRMMVKMQSGRLLCAYAYADCGDGESTTDMVFSGHSMLAEGGSLVAENSPFGGRDLVCAEVDLAHLLYDRRRMNTYPAENTDGYVTVEFSIEPTVTKLTRGVDPLPFVPGGEKDRASRCALILDIQSRGLARRLDAAHASGAVVAISGGLDSCLALLVTARAFDLLGRDRSDILTVTMPCYGTTKRTRGNAEQLCSELGTSFRCIDIADAVALHFRDIGHSEDDHSVVYENSQARERTQIIMDIANGMNAIVVGTGDLSELALGWATYNGDHMSNYGVNGGIPKTLIRHIVAYCADTALAEGRRGLSEVLRDILATPVSPELLPAKDGEIAQKTEDIVGPYELHDFFLFRMLRYGERPEKIFRMAVAAFSGEDHHFEPEVILKWLRIFTRRFFVQQFKRSCLPDGPKVGSVALSPRGDWRMPSDAQSRIWLDEVDKIKL